MKINEGGKVFQNIFTAVLKKVSVRGRGGRRTNPACLELKGCVRKDWRKEKVNNNITCKLSALQKRPVRMWKTHVDKETSRVFFFFLLFLKHKHNSTFIFASSVSLSKSVKTSQSVSQNQSVSQSKSDSLLVNQIQPVSQTKSVSVSQSKSVSQSVGQSVKICQSVTQPVS